MFLIITPLGGGEPVRQKGCQVLLLKKQENHNDANAVNNLNGNIRQMMIRKMQQSQQYYYANKPYITIIPTTQKRFNDVNNMTMST